MNKQTQLALFDEFTALQKQTLIGKADDYAGSDDRLNNFKVAGAVAGNSAALNCLNLIATKVARLGSLLKDGRAPKNEATEDSVLDLANYAFLLHCILKEQPVQYGYAEHQPELRASCPRPCSPSDMDAAGNCKCDREEIGGPQSAAEALQNLEAMASRVPPTPPPDRRLRLTDAVGKRKPVPITELKAPDEIEAGDTVECVDGAGALEYLVRGKNYVVGAVRGDHLSLVTLPVIFTPHKNRFKIIKKHNAS